MTEASQTKSATDDSAAAAGAAQTVANDPNLGVVKDGAVEAAKTQPDPNAQPGKKDGAQPEAKAGEGEKKPEGEAAKPQLDAGKFNMGEGLQADPELLGELAGIAGELGIPQEGAQKFVDLGAKFAKKIEQKTVEAVQKQQQEWVTQSQADKEFGGDALEASLGTAKRALDLYASPDLKQLLGEYDPKKNPKGTGLGNHPEIIRLFVRLGKTISEDKVVTSGADPTASGAGKTPAQVLYPNQGKT